MSSSPGAKPTFTHRSLVVFFSVAMVLISGSILRRDYKNRPQKNSKGTSKEQLLKELQGEVDVGRASISPDYLKEVVENDKLRTDTAKGMSPEIRKSIKERAFELLHKITPGETNVSKK